MTIHNFVEQIHQITKSNLPIEEARDAYLNYLDQRCDFREENFDYILRDFKKHEVFNKEKWQEVSEHHHNFILTLLWATNTTTPTSIARIIMGLESWEDPDEYLMADIRAIMPKPVFENTFPFEAMRPVQKGLFERIDQYLGNPDITDIIIDAPTGIGKSGIAIATLLSFGSGYLVTANKSLQNQYISEFNWLADLRGRSNYRCNEYEGYDCRSAPCQKTKDSRKECQTNGSCDYGEAKNRALKRSPFALMNMHALISYAVYAPKAIEPRKALIIDEAHSFPEVITGSVGLSLRLKTLTPYKVNHIPVYESPRRYSGWLKEIHEMISEDDSLLEDDDVKLKDRIEFIISLLDSDNLALDFERDPNDPSVVTAIKLYPIRVEHYYNSIKALGDIRVHLSATILGYETYCNMLGIESKNVAILRLGSPFPKEIRPIYLNHTVGQLSAKSIQVHMPKMVEKVDLIMDHYADYKGIIHGTTYAICNALYNGLSIRNRGRVLFARSSREQAECFQKHAESKNTVLLSPSMTEGVDLKNDLSRFQILTKTPYPYLGDPVIQKRKEIYPGYYETLTAVAIMQSYGRSTRHDQDWSHTFVLDENFKWFVRSNQKLFPQWFLDAIVY